MFPEPGLRRVRERFCGPCRGRLSRAAGSVLAQVTGIMAKAAKSKTKKDAGKVKNKGKKVKNAAKH